MDAGTGEGDGMDNTVIKENERKPGSAAFLGKRGLLVVLSPNHFGTSRVIDRAVTVIGRHGECDLSISDPLLSRKHCSVSADEKGDFFLEDLNSTNSTYLNSALVKGKTRLHYGDRILMGNTIVRFFVEEEIEKK
jgi:pSer/pThr/pTyr-binding forkhead associated (FHA) protein